VLLAGWSAFAFDVLGNLKAVSLLNGTNITYIVDPENHRVGKEVNGALKAGFSVRQRSDRRTVEREQLGCQPIHLREAPHVSLLDVERRRDLSHISR
jgi:hypothetical protein